LIFPGVQNGRTVGSLTAVETTSFKAQSLGHDVSLPAADRDEALEAIKVVRYNDEIPFPCIEGESPYSIGNSDSALGPDSGLLNPLGEEPDTEHAAYRLYLDELIGTQLIQMGKQKIGGEIIGRDLFGQDEVEGLLNETVGLAYSNDGSKQEQQIFEQDDSEHADPELEAGGSEDAQEDIFEMGSVDEFISYSENEYPEEDAAEDALLGDSGSLFGGDDLEEKHLGQADLNDGIPYSEDEHPDAEIPEQEFVDEDDFHSEGGYSEGDSIEGFFGEEGPQSLQHQNADN
jgi:hypothetical protein